MSYVVVGFFVTTGKKSSSCLSGGCVSFWFWREIGSFFVVAGKFYYNRKKKDTVICLAGARSLLPPEKKVPVICLAGAQSLLRPEKKFVTTGKKKSSSRLSGGCVSFLFWREIGSFFVAAGKFYYYRKKKIQSSVWRVRDHYYDRKKKFVTTGKKKVPVVCLAGVSVFGSGVKFAFFLLWRESFITTGKKRYSRLSGGCAIIITTGKKKSLRPKKKKSSSRLSGGCVSFWFWQEIGSFFVAAGKFYYYQKKKRYSRLSGGCAIIITTGKKIRYDRKKKSSSRLSGGCVSFWFWRKICIFLLWRESFITTGKKDTVICLADARSLLQPEKKIVTTGKKKFQSSVWRVCQFLVLAGNWQFFCCGGKVYYYRKKQRYSRLSGGWAIIITNGKKNSLRPEKKIPVVCLAGGSVFGSGGKLAVFLLFRECFITTGKKRYSRLSGGCAIIITT